MQIPLIKPHFSNLHGCTVPLLLWSIGAGSDPIHFSSVFAAVSSRPRARPIPAAGPLAFSASFRWSLAAVYNYAVASYLASLQHIARCSVCSFSCHRFLSCSALSSISHMVHHSDASYRFIFLLVFLGICTNLKERSFVC